MAKKAIKSEKLTPFGGIFAMMEQFDSMLSPIIDQTLGLEMPAVSSVTSTAKSSCSLMSVYFCGGSCVEVVITVIGCRHLSLHPTLAHLQL